MSPTEEVRLAGIVAKAVKDAMIGATGLSAQQASDVALAAATKAVQENQTRTFAILGVNINDAKEMAKFAADIEFLRAMHSNAGALGKRAAGYLLTAVLGGALLALWLGLKSLLVVSGRG